MQVVTDEKIHFYIIDSSTFKPQLENVMLNYMKCNQMLFGPRRRYCITFKTNQKHFAIYRRKYEHHFKVPVIATKVLDGAVAIELEKMKSYVVAKLDKIDIYDSETFE